MIYHIIVIGAGGTGSCFLQKLARFQAASSETIKVHVMDGDIIEDKNLKRQMFFSGDVDKNKAIALCELASESYGVDWIAVPSYLKEARQLDDLCIYEKNEYVCTILVGATDNHPCRRVMEDWFSKQVDGFYIDSANDEFDGEIIVATRALGMDVSPMRSHYFPDVLTDDSPAVDEMSCEERNNSTPQHQTVNEFAGNLILSVVSQIMDRTVPTGMILFDIKNFSLRRFPFEDGRLAV